MNRRFFMALTALSPVSCGGIVEDTCLGGNNWGMGLVWGEFVWESCGDEPNEGDAVTVRTVCAGTAHGD